VRIANENEGGFDGRGALSGILWCSKCADGPIRTPKNIAQIKADLRRLREEHERRKRHAFIKAAQLKVEEAARADVEAILAEFGHLDGLLRKSWAALTKLRRDPAVVGVQRELVLLSREYTRDVTVMIHGFQQRHW
jgi:hypothetical protein